MRGGGRRERCRRTTTVFSFLDFFFLLLLVVVVVCHSFFSPSPPGALVSRPKSYNLVTLVGIWLLPPLFLARTRPIVFLATWVVFSCREWKKEDTHSIHLLGFLSFSSLCVCVCVCVF